VRERTLIGVAGATSAVAAKVPAAVLNLATLTALGGWRKLRGTPWWGLDEIARHDWAQIVEAGRQTGRFDSRRWISGVSVPTAVIVTQNDEVVPVRRQIALADAIRGATIRTVRGGHGACTSAPESFVPELVDACSEVAGRAHRPVVQTPAAVDIAA
jgi:pimeloyl-ACP methyl ester carboxylesterase